jgi:MFS family permease
MTTHDPTTPATGTASGKSANKMPKVAFASFMGTVIEFYDFGIYGTAAALVFAQSFFPALGENAGTVASFATLGVAFVARPLGSILFGHFGDRLGRKRTLIATMTLMGVATVLIGLLPTAASIGVIAPVILVVLRIAQGIAAGGEWAGAALFTVENAPTARRGFWAMFTNLGGAVANILALSTFLLAAQVMSDATFVEWGWRVPFLISVVLVVLGLYVRLRLQESPVFAQEVERRRASRLPFKEAVANDWQQILIGAGSLVMAFALGYIGIAYLTNYGTATLGFSESEVLLAGIFGNLINGAAIISGGTLSDRMGRRRVLLVVNAIAVPWALLLFPLLDTNSLAAFWVGMTVSFVLAGHGFGVAGSFLSELFQTRYRYTGAGLAYSLAAIIGGAVTPLVASAVIAKYSSIVFGVILAGFCAASVICTLVARETRGRDLTDVPAEA